MGVAGSRFFVNQMIRDGVEEEANDVFEISSDEDGRFDTVNCFERSVRRQQDDDNEDDTMTNLLLSLVVHHSNVRRILKKKNRKLLLLKVAELRRRHAIVTLPYKKTRTARSRFFIDPVSGMHRPMTPKLSQWWVLYIQDPKPECRHWSKSFRQRFRLPYQSFLHILSMLEEDSNDVYFQRWRKSTTSPSVQLGKDNQEARLPFVVHQARSH